MFESEEIHTTNILQNIIPSLSKQSLTLNLLDLLYISSTSKRKNSSPPTTKSLNKSFNHPNPKLNSSLKSLSFLPSLNYQQTFYRPRIIQNMLSSQILTPSQQMQNTELRNQLLITILSIHSEHNLKYNIAHLAGNIIDRYLTKCSINRDNYLRLGLSALWISDKVLNKKPWSLKKWINCVDGVSKEEVIEMEADILRQIQYEVLIPTAVNFLEIFSTYFSMKQYQYNICVELIELTMVECQWKEWKESEIALSCLVLHDMKYTFEEEKDIKSKLFRLSMKPSMLKKKMYLNVLNYCISHLRNLNYTTKQIFENDIHQLFSNSNYSIYL